MAIENATIAVTPYITVRGTLMKASMMLAKDFPDAGHVKVMVDGKVFEGKRLDTCHRRPE